MSEMRQSPGEEMATYRHLMVMMLNQGHFTEGTANAKNAYLIQKHRGRFSNG